MGAFGITGSVAAALIALAGSLAVPALADESVQPAPREHDLCQDGEDHNLALDARQDERIRPLDDILDALPPELRGVVIEIEVECEGERLRYELKLRTPDGRIVELLVDAMTGEVLEQDD